MDSAEGEDSQSTTSSLIVLPEIKPFVEVQPPVYYVYDERMLLHREIIPTDHPECPARLFFIHQALQQAEILPLLHHLPARRVLESELLSLHTPEHLSLIQATREMEEESLIHLQEQHDSLYICRESEEAAALAAGSTIDVIQSVMSHDRAAGMSLVRPPGHHAEHDRAMGFCLYNNVAVAVKVLQQQQPQLRILIVDWDVHHGNGTQRAFKEDPNVLFISIHRGDLYPMHSADEARPDYVGEGPGVGKSVNVAWNGGGMGDSDYAMAFERIVLPMAREFKPDLCIVSAGFDAAEGDPIGGCAVTPAGYGYLTHALRGICNRLVLVLEGGYNVVGQAMSVLECAKVLLGHSPPSTPLSQWPCPSDAAMEAIHRTLRAHSSYWRCLVPRWHPQPVREVAVKRAQGDDVVGDGNESGLPEAPSLPSLIKQSWLDRLESAGFEMVAKNGHFHAMHLRRHQKRLLVIAHEWAAVQCHGHLLLSDALPPQRLSLDQPWAEWISKAMSCGWSCLDLCTPPRSWKLRQSPPTGSAALQLNEQHTLLLQLWRQEVTRYDEVVIISSGQLSYSIANLIDEAGEAAVERIRSIFIFSSTLYLPIVSVDRAEWYRQV